MKNKLDSVLRAANRAARHEAISVEYIDKPTRTQKPNVFLHRDALWRSNACVCRFPADWTTYDRSAGPIRNQQMLDEGQPEAGFAFYTDKSQSRGARDMASRLFLAGRIVCEYDERLRGWLT